MRLLHAGLVVKMSAVEYLLTACDRGLVICADRITACCSRVACLILSCCAM